MESTLTNLCSQRCSLFRSSIFRKQVVALTGLGLSGFLLTHVLGNSLMFLGPEAYNSYSHKLITNPFIYVAEVGLAVLFLVHVGLTIRLTLENRRARPNTPGALASEYEKRARFGSRSMILTGLLTFVFLVFHLITFKWGTYYEATYQGVAMRDLHRLVIEKFNQPLYTGWYLLCLVVLGVHLSHGFSAAFQSLGVENVRSRGLKRIGWAFAILIAGGFIAQPIYAILVGGK